MCIKSWRRGRKRERGRERERGGGGGEKEREGKRERDILKLIIKNHQFMEVKPHGAGELSLPDHPRFLRGIICRSFALT